MTQSSSNKVHIELPIYESVRDSQLQHGLKYDDHRQYRSYCSRRLHRIRRSLNVHQNVQPTAKARHQRAKKLMEVSNSMVLEAGEKENEYAHRMLIIPLCLAERAWSFAMQLKQEVAEYPRKRFHMVRRLKKAAQYASKFEKLVHDAESPCSDRTKKEATAYAAYMNGLYTMEREKWSEAKESFKTSLLLYVALSLSVKDARMVEQYRIRIEELRASLRYCQFSLGEKPQTAELPSTMQFHDIAFRHAKQMKEEAPPRPTPVAVAKKAEKPVEVAMIAQVVEQKEPKQDKKQKQVIQKQKQQQQQQKQQAQPVKAEKPKAKAKQESPPAKPVEEKKKEKEPEKVAVQEEEDEEEEDEYQEADEGSEEDTSSDEDDDQPQQSGGVTGLVKGWLGGAWSGR